MREKRGARPKIATVERREASVSERRKAPRKASGVPRQATPRRCTEHRSVISALRHPSSGCAKQKSKTRAQKRAAGTKKRVLFDK